MQKTGRLKLLQNNNRKLIHGDYPALPNPRYLRLKFPEEPFAFGRISMYA